MIAEHVLLRAGYPDRRASRQPLPLLITVLPSSAPLLIALQLPTAETQPPRRRSPGSPATSLSGTNPCKPQTPSSPLLANLALVTTPHSHLLETPIPLLFLPRHLPALLTLIRLEFLLFTLAIDRNQAPICLRRRLLCPRRASYPRVTTMTAGPR